MVDFAGIEEFIDVPVKRYSSGMYVRLAYAVASMLRSDILLLDEVLAVGDVAFQEKARSSMQQIAASGRTILFVSHHPTALAAICEQGLVLDRGKTVYYGDIQSALRLYLVKLLHIDSLADRFCSFNDISDFPRLYAGHSRVLKSVALYTVDGISSATFMTGGDMKVRIGYANMKIQFPYFTVKIHNEYGACVATINSTHTGDPLYLQKDGFVECLIKDIRLGEGVYTIMLDYGSCAGTRETFVTYDCVPAAIKFQVELGGFVKGIGLDPFQGAAHRSVWTQGPRGE
jgi:lipopolysaccharide transport system ATP-binding protein